MPADEEIITVEIVSANPRQPKFCTSQFTIVQVGELPPPQDVYIQMFQLAQQDRSMEFIKPRVIALFQRVILFLHAVEPQPAASGLKFFRGSQDHAAITVTPE